MGRVLASGGSCIPKRALFGMLLQRGLGMWGRERNVPSGMNCGFWGQGQTEPPSAFLEATKRPVQREETERISFVWSGTQQHRIQSPFWHLGNKKILFHHAGSLACTPLLPEEGWVWGCPKRTRQSKVPAPASFMSN